MPPVRRSAKYIISGQAFGTKEAIKDHVRRVRRETKFGDAIQDPVVLSLLRLHPQWSEKSVGMTAVSVDMLKGSPAGGYTKEIVILRGDLPFMDISWHHIIKAMKPGGGVEFKSDHLDELRKAARFSIEPQLQPLRPPGMVIDHVFPWTFEQLLFDWFRAHPELRKISDVRITGNDGAEVVRSWDSTKLERDWIEYHRRYAQLEPVTKEEHYKRTRRSHIDWTPFM